MRDGFGEPEVHQLEEDHLNVSTLQVQEVD